MSTKTQKGHHLKKALTLAILEADEFPVIESVNLIFKVKGTSLATLAKQAGISRQAAYADLHGKRVCPRFRKQAEKVLGCIPW